MLDFFAPAIPADVLQSPALRIVPVLGDGMCDTYRANYDYVLMRPVSGYVGEGVYVVSDGIGFDFHRVESTMDGKRGLRLFRDNPAYRDKLWTVEEFEANVLGIIVADIKVRNSLQLKEAIQ